MLRMAMDHQPGVGALDVLSLSAYVSNSQAAIKDKFPDIKQVEFAEH
jgi:hypothetical protein